MVDQITASRNCSVCGATLSDDQSAVGGLCRLCVGDGMSQREAQPQPIESAPPMPDPDNPHWGPGTGIGVWLASVAAIVFIPAIAVVAWYLLEAARGVVVPALTVNGVLNAEFLKWTMSPPLLLLQISSTIVAHA